MVPPIKVLVLVLVLVPVLGATMCTQRSESRCSLAHLSQDREVEGRHVQSLPRALTMVTTAPPIITTPASAHPGCRQHPV